MEKEVLYKMDELLPTGEAKVAPRLEGLLDEFVGVKFPLESNKELERGERAIAPVLDKVEDGGGVTAPDKLLGVTEAEEGLEVDEISLRERNNCGEPDPDGVEPRDNGEV